MMQETRKKKDGADGDREVLTRVLTRVLARMQALSNDTVLTPIKLSTKAINERFPTCHVERVFRKPFAFSGPCVPKKENRW